MKISICLTVYERAESLGATLESLLAQSRGDFELLVQDDSLSDAPEAICRRFAKLDDRISYERNPNNLGMPGNLNAAVKRSRGELLANLHDGDIYQSTLIERWAQALESSDAAFVFNGYRCIEPDGVGFQDDIQPFPAIIPATFLTKFMLERFGSPVWGTVMARKKAYDDMGPFNERYSWISDVEMWMRLNLKYPVAYIPEILQTLNTREADRPYARVNWQLEVAHVEMREEIASTLFQGDRIAKAAFLLRLRRRKRARWIRIMSHCVRRRKWATLVEGARIMSRDRDPSLRLLGLIGARFPCECLESTYSDEKK